MRDGVRNRLHVLHRTLQLGPCARPTRRSRLALSATRPVPARPHARGCPGGCPDMYKRLATGAAAVHAAAVVDPDPVPRPCGAMRYVAFVERQLAAPVPLQHAFGALQILWMHQAAPGLKGGGLQFGHGVAQHLGPAIVDSPCPRSRHWSPRCPGAWPPAPTAGAGVRRARLPRPGRRT